MSVNTIQTGFTGMAANPGKKNADEFALFMKNFSGEVLEAWKQMNVFEDTMFTRSITTGKVDTFPIIGRKDDAFEHVKGELITGGDIDHNEIEIGTDRPLVDSLFLDEIDDLMIHYDVRAPYARKLAESLNNVFDRRAAVMSIIAARDNTPIVPNTTLAGKVITDAALVTDPEVITDAIYEAWEHVKDNDISGEDLQAFLRSKQYALLARTERLDAKRRTGTADITKGTIQQLAGIDIVLAPHLPKKNLVATPAAADEAKEANVKYQGDFRNTVGLIKNKMAAGLLNRRGLRTTITFKEDRLGWVFITSRACGFGKLRPECAIELASA